MVSKIGVFPKLSWVLGFPFYISQAAALTSLASIA